MAIQQTALGLSGVTRTAAPAGPPPPVLTVSYALQCEGVPQQFPAPPQEQNLAVGNLGFQVAVAMLDAEGNPLNLTGASQVELLIVWPGGQPQVVPAAFLTNGTDGAVAATLPVGFGGGWGLYHVYAFAVVRGQVLRTQAGRLWYGRGLQ
jgi:hypothetical protein